MASASPSGKGGDVGGGIKYESDTNGGGKGGGGGGTTGVDETGVRGGNGGGGGIQESDVADDVDELRAVEDGKEEDEGNSTISLGRIESWVIKSDNVV